MITLYHLPISHYNEKVRWALDLKGLPHRRKALLPGIHRVVSRRLGGVGTTPVLVDDAAGVRLGDSTTILQHLERLAPTPSLYPESPEKREQALQMEDILDETAGRSVRSYSYSLIVDEPGALSRRWKVGLSWPQKVAVTALVPLIKPALRKGFDLSPESAPRHRQAVFAAIEQLERWLQVSGSGYLVGDRFGVADLTAASLFGPAVGPPGSPWAAGGAPVPAAFEEYRQEVRSRDGGRWVLEIWKRHRIPARQEVA